MEIIVISAIFFAIVFGGFALAVTLVARAIRADEAYLENAEQSPNTATSEPSWVHP